MSGVSIQFIAAFYLTACVHIQIQLLKIVRVPPASESSYDDIRDDTHVA